MSGHKQPAVVKQTREVGSSVYFTVEALLSAIDNLVHRVVSGRVVLTRWVIHINRKQTS